MSEQEIEVEGDGGFEVSGRVVSVLGGRWV